NGLGGRIWRPPPQPVHLRKSYVMPEQGCARSDDDAPRWRVDLQHIEGVAFGDAEAPPLPDCEVDRALVPAKHATIHMNDVAGLGRIGPELHDEIGIAAFGHETDILAVGLVRHRKPDLRRDAARLALGDGAERK